MAMAIAIAKSTARCLSLLFLTLQLLSGDAFGRDEPEEAFSFVQLTDTHWGDRDHLDRTEKAVASIGKIPFPLTCVVHTGDILADRIGERELVDRGLALMSRLPVPIHYVAGNHDILKNRHEPAKRAYLSQFGELAAHADYHGVRFIFIYTEPLRKSFPVAGYDPLKRLEALLEQADGKPVILFHHAPSVSDFYNNRMHSGWPGKLRERWVELINAHNVKAVVAGHFHRDEFHWLGRVPLYVSSSIAGYWGRQASYRIYHYSGGKLGYRTVYLP